MVVEAGEALQTDFIQGMLHNSLKSEFYIPYMLQDMVYLLIADFAITNIDTYQQYLDGISNYINTCYPTVR